MSWYLLTQYRAASLPANVLATTAGQCLEAVVQEIQRGNYNKARWMWYTRILDYSNEGVYNMEGSTFRNFNEHLSVLFSITRESIYSCSSPTCPNPAKTHRRRTAGWQLSTGSIINQAAINKSVEESIRPAEKTNGDMCTERPADDMSDSAIYENQGAWRQIEMVDEEGRNTYSVTCSGSRIHKEPRFTQLPTLLSIDARYNVNHCNASFPAPVLHFGKQEYQLGAVIYHGQFHFCSVVMVEGKRLLYDGVMKRKCQFVSEKDITRLLANRNFHAAEAWYLKYPVTSYVGQELEDEALYADKEFDELSGDEQVRSWSPPPLAPKITNVPVLKNVNTPTPSKLTNMPTPKDTNTPAPISLLNDDELPDVHELLHKRRLSDDSIGPSPATPPRKKPHYDIGFSKCLVATKGPLPQCAGCHTPILRTLHRARMVHKYIIRQSWMAGGMRSNTRSYHYQRSCIDRAVQQGLLTLNDLEDARSVFAEDAEVTDNSI